MAGWRLGGPDRGPRLYSAAPSTLRQEAPHHRFGYGSPGRETRSRALPAGQGWQIAAILLVGLIVRLIMAYGIEGLRGSGFGSDLDLFHFWAADLAEHGPFGFYDRGFFADYTPGYLYALWAVGVVGSCDRRVGDLIKLPAIITDVVLAYVVYRMVLDLGVTSGRARARGVRRDRQPDHLVRLRDLGPGRQLRDGVPAARRPRAVEGPAGAGRDPRGDRGAHQAPAGDPHPDRRVRHHPARPVAGRRLRRRGGARAHGLRLGAAVARLDPDPDDGPRGVRHGGRHRRAVRAVGRLVLRPWRRTSTAASCGSCSAPRRRTPTSPSTPTTCGRCSRSTGRARRPTASGSPTRRWPTPRSGPRSARSRPSWSAACSSGCCCS